jgi:hypothetical protein
VMSFLLGIYYKWREGGGTPKVRVLILVCFQVITVY